MAGPVPAAGPHHGRVASFDPARGLGAMQDDDGASYGFHATAIADGSRRVEVGTTVRVHGDPRPARALRSVVAAARLVLSVPPPAPVVPGEDLKGGVGAGAVTGGEQVEQQATHDREPEAGMGPGHVCGHAQRADSVTLASIQCSTSSFRSGRIDSSPWSASPSSAKNRRSKSPRAGSAR